MGYKALPITSALEVDQASLPTNVSTAGIMTNKFGHRILQMEVKFTF
jgi:hypothetical protein